MKKQRKEETRMWKLEEKGKAGQQEGILLIDQLW
jgi:hypothetical protein